MSTGTNDCGLWLERRGPQKKDHRSFDHIQYEPMHFFFFCNGPNTLQHNLLMCVTTKPCLWRWVGLTVSCGSSACGLTAGRHEDESRSVLKTQRESQSCPSNHNSTFLLSFWFVYVILIPFQKFYQENISLSDDYKFCFFGGTVPAHESLLTSCGQK